MMRSWGPTLWEWLLPIPIADIPISHSIMDRDTITLSGKQYNIYIYINNIHSSIKPWTISMSREKPCRLAPPGPDDPDYIHAPHTHIYIYIYLPRIYTYANTVNNMYKYIYTLYTIYIYYALYVCMFVHTMCENVTCSSPIFAGSSPGTRSPRNLESPTWSRWATRWSNIKWMGSRCYNWMVSDG